MIATSSFPIGRFGADNRRKASNSSGGGRSGAHQEAATGGGQGRGVRVLYHGSSNAAGRPVLPGIQGGRSQPPGTVSLFGRTAAGVGRKAMLAWMG